MAVSSGVAPHTAYLNQWPVESGSVEQQGTRKASTFSVMIPMSLPGAMAAFASPGDISAVITVSGPGGSGTLLTGEIDVVAFDMISRTIHVSGRDKSAELHHRKTSEKWLNKKGSDIVTDLAGRAGLSVQADASTLMAGKKLEKDFVRLSDNVSFAYVIHKLAEFDGARWFVDPMGTLHYQSKSNPLGIYTINYSDANGRMSADCLRLSIRQNVQAGKNIKVSVKSWHPKQKKVFEGKANIGGSGGVLDYVYHIPGLLKDHVQQHADAKAREHAHHERTVDAVVVGDPSINAGMGLMLAGTGFFDQMYEMDRVHHQFGMSGYTTSIVAKSAREGRSGGSSGFGGGFSGSTPDAGSAAPAQGGGASVPGAGTPL